MKFTKRLILCGVLALLSATSATAGPIRDRIAARLGQPAPSQQVSYQPQQGYATAPTSSGVQWKADVQASRGQCFHPGGGFVAGASYEGVGYSSASPADALAHCCNNGGPVVAQAVAAGPGGYYAVKQYATPGTSGTPGVVRQAVGGTVQGVGQVVQYAGGVLVHGTSYQPPVATSGAVYAPIRMGGVVLPTTCSGGVCR